MSHLKSTVPVSKARLAIAVLFAAELAVGVVALFLYDGAMSIGFLVTLPLLGLLISLRRDASPGRTKLFYTLQALLFVLPPLLFLGFQPNVSHEKAVTLVRSHMADTAVIVNEGQKSFIAMEGLSNPFITKGYKFVVSEKGALTEYVVNPVTGKVSELHE